MTSQKKLKARIYRENRKERSLKRIEEIEDALKDSFDLADSAAINIVWSRCRSGATHFLHVMFNDLDSRRLLNWWPSKGNWWCPLDNSKGNCTSIDDALFVADQKRSENA